MTRMLLAALLAVLAVAVGLEAMEEAPGVVAVRTVPASGAPARSPAIVAEAGPTEVRTILARPLFAPNRRPPAGGVALPNALPPSLPRVAGILMNGGQRSVIFASTGDTRPMVVHEGGELNGFRVQAIEDGQVTVVGPDGPRVLHPSFDPNPPAAPANRGVATPQIPGLPGLPGLSGLPGIPGLPALPVGTGQPDVAR